MIHQTSWKVCQNISYSQQRQKVLADRYRDQLIGPLCRAIVLQSEQGMLLVLNSSPHGAEAMLREDFRVRRSAITAANLIMLWFPQGLPAVLGSLGLCGNTRGQREALQLMANTANLPLLGSLTQGMAYASMFSRPKDHYLATAALLLELDCAVPVCGPSLDLNMPIVAHNDGSLIPGIVQHLANRRRRLREYAKEHLDVCDCELPGLFEVELAGKPLDGPDASRVWEALEMQGTTPPEALNPWLKGWSCENNGKPWAYRDCTSAETAEELFREGFALDQMVLSSAHNFSRGLSNTFEFGVWLQARCKRATLEAMVKQPRGVSGQRVQHVLAAFSVDLTSIFHDLDRDPIPRTPDIPPVSTLHLGTDGRGVVPVADDCQCHCSSHGCTMLTSMITQMLIAMYIENSLRQETEHMWILDTTLDFLLWFARC